MIETQRPIFGVELRHRTPAVGHLLPVTIVPPQRRLLGLRRTNDKDSREAGVVILAVLPGLFAFQKLLASDGDTSSANANMLAAGAASGQSSPGT